MAALLDRLETIKKDKHGKHCHNQWNFLCPFFIYVDVMLGRNALVVLKKLIWIMAAKMEEPILHVR